MRKVSDQCEASPKWTAYLMGFHQAHQGKRKKPPRIVNTDQLRARFDEGYKDGIAERQQKKEQGDGIR